MNEYENLNECDICKSKKEMAILSKKRKYIAQCLIKECEALNSVLTIYAENKYGYYCLGSNELHTLFQTFTAIKFFYDSGLFGKFNSKEEKCNVFYLEESIRGIYFSIEQNDGEIWHLIELRKR